MALQRGSLFKCTDPACDLLMEAALPCECDESCSIELSCCGKPMKQLAEKTADAATEKHVPVIETLPGGGYKVTVGSIPHPMEEDHYIQLIELQIGDLVAKTYLKPGDAPEATFFAGCCCGEECGQPIAREVCNKHGLWKG